MYFYDSKKYCKTTKQTLNATVKDGLLRPENIVKRRFETMQVFKINLLGAGAEFAENWVIVLRGNGVGEGRRY